MAYEKLMQTVRKCVLGGALPFNTHSCVFALFLCGAEFNFGVGCIWFERVLDNTQLDTPGRTPPHERSARST